MFSKIEHYFKLFMKYYVLNSSSMLVGESGERLGSKFILSSVCSFCGTGAKYVKHFIIKPPKNKTLNVFQTLDADYIVSDVVYKDLLNNNCKVSFPKTVNLSNKELPYRHLTSDVELPKVYSSPYLRVDPLSQCIHCKKNGWLGTPDTDGFLLLTYRNVSNEILSNSDVFITWERNGVSRNTIDGEFGIRFARPFIIVSEKVKNILMKYNRHLIFEEVLFIETP